MDKKQFIEEYTNTIKEIKEQITFMEEADLMSDNNILEYMDDSLDLTDANPEEIIFSILKTSLSLKKGLKNTDLN